jgi:hypothetical protein
MQKQEQTVRCMELFPDDDRGLGGLLGPMAPRRRTKVRSWNARKKNIETYNSESRPQKCREKTRNTLMVKIPLSPTAEERASPLGTEPDVVNFRSRRDGRKFPKPWHLNVGFHGDISRHFGVIENL